MLKVDLIFRLAFGSVNWQRNFLKKKLTHLNSSFNVSFFGVWNHRKKQWLWNSCNVCFVHAVSCKIEDVTKLEKAKTAQDCFKILFKENIISPSDVIAMQFLLIRTQCDELEKECVEYAKQQKAMHFYEKPPGNMHVLYNKLIH